MKKLIFAMGVLCLFLTACGGEESATTTTPAPEDYVSTSDAAQAVADYLGWDDLSPMEEDDRDFYLSELYGIEEGSWTEATIYAATGADARELVVLRLSDKEYEDTVFAAFGEYCKARQGDFFGYFPREAAMVEKAVMMAADGYVALFICDDPKGAAKALAAVLNGEEPPKPVDTPAPVVETSSPVQETPPAETPSPTPTETPAQSPGPVPSATPEDGPAPTLDTSSFIPYDPPNKHVMLLYNTTAIREAYTSGDESELSERDTAILTRCKEGLEECITEDMSDFEKELALRDWMLEQGEYDKTVLDGRSRFGQQDSGNPYGYLVRGYGICLGYTSTFQLLMDLAGVECITVVGAAFNSTETHAWNMVKLEGEWYCVDTTWDLEGGYQYFNITSERMRQTNHQWDYENVPEATATRFYWNGYGEKPE